MPFRPDGSHYINIFEKQARLVNTKKKFNLASGPRLCGKTISVAHAVAKHMRITPGARFTMIGPSATNNEDGGAWVDLTGQGGVIDQWVDDGLLEWVDKPRIKGVTKKVTCSVYSPVTDFVGELQLDSLSVEDDVQRKFFNRRFSCIWVTQIDETFRKRHSFDTVTELLRMPNIRDDQHRFFADCNPPKEGKDSWIYKLWFEFPEEEIPEHITGDDRMALEELKSNLSVTCFSIDDNIFVTPQRKRELYAKLAHDENLVARFWRGEYVKATTTGIFAEVWRPVVHVVGSAGTGVIGSHNDEEHLAPEENCIEMLAGWDLGAKNPAVELIEPVNISQDPNKNVYAYKVLSEVVLLKEVIPLDEFVGLVMDEMEKIEKMAGRKLMWQHWSDTSSFTQKGDVEEFEARAVWRYSEERIDLKTVLKGRNSVMRQVNLIKKLIFQDRVYVDVGCQALIRTFGNISTNRHGRLFASDPDKHALDAFRYAVCSKSWDELDSGIVAPSGLELPVVKMSL